MTNRSDTVAPGISQEPAGSRVDRAMWAAADALRLHWLLGLLLVAGLALRVVAQVGYEPALLFIDSKKYIFGTQFDGAQWGSYDPIGYTLLVLQPGEKWAGVVEMAFGS